MSILRDRLLAACDANGVTQKSVTELAEHRDPYRLDTPAMHQAGKWLAEEMRRLRVRTPVHLRGLFYASVAAGDVRKPDFAPFVNTNDDWVWLSEKVAKAARWLGYVDWTAIKDERNEPLEIYLPEPKRWSPNALISFDLRLELPSPDKFEPLVYVDGFGRALAERADTKTDAELRAGAEKCTARVREKVEALGISDSEQPPAPDLPA